MAYELWPEQEGTRVAWGDLTAEVGPMTVTRETKRVFRERIPLAKYLTAAGGRVPAAVDFERRQLLLVSSGPRSSTGYSMEVLQVRERDGSVTVTVRERTPELGERVEPRVTFPYRLLSLPAGTDVYVDWLGR
ncbi:MAG: protease complex subunit PrcB family protein [Gaiellaceae bacterium]